MERHSYDEYVYLRGFIRQQARGIARLTRLMSEAHPFDLEGMVRGIQERLPVMLEAIDRLRANYTKGAISPTDELRRQQSILGWKPRKDDLKLRGAESQPEGEAR